MRTLVLNATYEPLGVTTWQRAVILVLDGTAEVIELSGRKVRASKLSLDAPSVVRLNRCVRVARKQRTPFSRRAVLVRDGHRCGYCNRFANTIDHVMPRSRGGLNIWENVVAACGACNHKKASKTPKEAGMALVVAPREPSLTSRSSRSRESPNRAGPIGWAQQSDRWFGGLSFIRVLARAPCSDLRLEHGAVVGRTGGGTGS